MDEDFAKQAYERQRTRWEQDFDDLNREAAGVQGNRISRFKGDDAGRHLTGTNKKDEGADELAEFVLSEMLTTQRDMLLRRIDMLDRASFEALVETEKKLVQAREDLDRLRDNAYQLPDGTKVYRTEDGAAVYDDDGNRLGNDVIDPAAIPDNKPTWEDRQRRGERVDQFQRERRDIQDYRDRLDRARDKLGDDDLSSDDIEGVEQGIDETMPQSVRRHYDRLAGHDPDLSAGSGRTASAASAYVGKPNLGNNPTMADSFAAAVAGLPQSSRPAPDAPAAIPAADDLTR